MSRRTRVAINGRFLTMPVTGVQRFARELLGALLHLEAVDAVAIVPPRSVIELDGQLPIVEVSDRWSGRDGHLWEQVSLPVLSRRTGADLLLSPCNWGPLAVRAQLPLFHDMAPLFHPQYFDSRYARWASVVTPRLVRKTRRAAATCERVKQELVRFAAATPVDVDVVPPAVGPPFSDLPVDAGARRSRVCVFVGGNDARKNLAFLRSFWPEAHRRLGLELHVVARSWTSARRVEAPGHEAPEGVVVHTDLDDAELAKRYADALCLLWPSLYEGYGLPLLEAMAVGTPFLSTDTGAAQELAIERDQVLPLDTEVWLRQLESWCCEDPVELRQASVARARSATWPRSAEAMMSAIARSCAA